MQSYNDNMMDEMGASVTNQVADEFQHMQERHGDDVAAHKAELGLEPHETFSLDEFMSKDEQDLFNKAVEGSDEYKQYLEVFKHRMIAHGMVEATKWAQMRASTAGADPEKTLDAMLDVQEEMSKLMSEINPLTKKRERAMRALDSWVKRYNKWKESPNYRKVPNTEKQNARKAFFTGLDKRKAYYANVKAEVMPSLLKLWKLWNAHKERADKIAGGNEWVWTMYYNLMNEELNNYFTTGDTEDVDDFSLLANTQGDVIELLAWSHVQEMSAEDAPEASGSGFWKLGTYLEDKEEARKASQMQMSESEENAYMDSLMNAEPQF